MATPAGTAIEAAGALDWTREQINLITRTVARGTSDDELALFLHVAKRSGLDPMAKQIYAIMRKDNRAGRDVMSIQTGIDGYRLAAQRSGEMDGQDGPYWCGADGQWSDVWLTLDAPPYAAKVVVYRRGCSRGFAAVANFNDYAQRFADGNLMGLWNTMAPNMIAKCAEALALRKAFPADLSGIYTHEEMQQAGAQAPLEEQAPEPTQRTLPTNAAPAAEVDKAIASNDIIIPPPDDADAPRGGDWVSPPAIVKPTAAQNDEIRKLFQVLTAGIEKGGPRKAEVARLTRQYAACDPTQVSETTARYLIIGLKREVAQSLARGGK